MSQKQPNYGSDELAAHNRKLDRLLRRWPPMNLKVYKLLKNILVSIGIIAFAFYAVGEGADPQPVFSGVVIVLALVNGVELPELYAAYAQVSSDRPNENSRDDS